MVDHNLFLLPHVIIIDSNLQYQFSSHLNHENYFIRIKIFEKYKTAAGLKTNSQHLPIWDPTADGWR